MSERSTGRPAGRPRPHIYQNHPQQNPPPRRAASLPVEQRKHQQRRRPNLFDDPDGSSERTAGKKKVIRWGVRVSMNQIFRKASALLNRESSGISQTFPDRRAQRLNMRIISEVRVRVVSKHQGFSRAVEQFIPKNFDTSIQRFVAMLLW